MTEEHGAYWQDSEQDGFRLVYKRYEPKVDLIAAVYYRHPACRSVIFERAAEQLGGPSKWIERPPAALFHSLMGAIGAAERMLTEPTRYTNTIVDLPPEFDVTDSRGVRYIKGGEVVPSWTSIIGRVLLVFASLVLSNGQGASEGLDEMFGGTYRRIRLRKTLLKLRAVDTVAAQFRVSPEDVKRIAEEKRIMPQININGTDYYNPDDFGDMTTLLQPSSAPSNDMLLQPVSASVTHEGTLLSSSDSSEQN